MPIDAVWIVATVPQKRFEQTLISFSNKLNLAVEYQDHKNDGVGEDEKFQEDFYLENDKQKPYMEKVS